MFWSFRSIFNPTKNDWILIVLVDFKLYHHTPICTCLHGELGEKHILKTYAANRNPRLKRWTDGKNIVCASVEAAIHGGRHRALI